MQTMQDGGELGLLVSGGDCATGDGGRQFARQGSGRA